MTKPSARARAGTRDSMISLRFAQGLVEGLEHVGIPRATFLAATGWTPAFLASPEARIPRAELYRACALALEITGDPALGLRWARRASERVFAPVAQLMTYASDLHHAIALLDRFAKLLADQPDHVVHESDREIALQCFALEGEALPLRRLAAELIVGGFWHLVRSFSATARPLQVAFAYPAPSYREAYDRFFGTAVRFEQPVTAVTFDRALLAAPSPAKDDDVREALEAIAQRRLLRVTASRSYADRVRHFLVHEGWPDRTDMSSVASALDLSVRSLRRHLEAEGISFVDLQCEALASVAQTLLRDPQRTVQEVAFEMGFSDPSAFHRAFKRWTGTTPKRYRSSLID